MGVVNVTPDSFFEDSRRERDDAADRVVELARAGAQVIDIGGESTRPGSQPVPPREQWLRIEPALTRAVALGSVIVSVDTQSAEVAERSLRAGAHWINDVSCLADDELARVVRRQRAALVLMHSRPDMKDMRGFSDYPEAGYDEVVSDVRSEWSAARERAVAVGLAHEDVLFDPGFGFSKSARQSLELLRRLGEFRSLGATMVVGPSRKSFLARVDGAGPADRLGGTMAACLWAAREGASIVRVHDVHEVRQALGLWQLLEPEVSHA